MKPKRPLFGLADKDLFEKHWMVTAWKKNSEQRNCYSCDKEFGSIYRYHHCRCCGNCICSKCSVFRCLFPFGYAQTRICVNCDQKPELHHIIHGKFAKDREAFKHQLNCVRAVPASEFELESFQVRATEFAAIHYGVQPSSRRELVTLKCFRKTVSSSQDFNIMYREANCLRAMNDPHIVKLLASNIGAQDKVVPSQPYIITPRSSFGTLGEFLKQRFFVEKEQQVRLRSLRDWYLLLEMLLQIIQTLKYLKDHHKIMHNDVCSCNVSVVCDRLPDAAPGLTTGTAHPMVENPLAKGRIPPQSSTKSLNPLDEFRIRSFSTGTPGIPSTRLSTVVEERESIMDRSICSTVSATPDRTVVGKSSFSAPVESTDTIESEYSDAGDGGAGGSDKHLLHSYYSSNSALENSSFSSLPVLIQLTDFANLRSSGLRTYHINPVCTHRAPEIWRNEPYDFKADAFSFGQLVAEVLLVERGNFMTNYFEDEDGSGTLIQRAICSGIMPPIGREKSKIGQELGELVKECWKSRTKRPDFATLESVLNSIIRVYCLEKRGKKPSNVEMKESAH